MDELKADLQKLEYLKQNNSYLNKQTKASAGTFSNI